MEIVCFKNSDNSKEHVNSKVSFLLKMQTNQRFFTEAELRSRILQQLSEIILLFLFSGIYSYGKSVCHE